MMLYMQIRCLNKGAFETLNCAGRSCLGKSLFTLKAAAVVFVILIICCLNIIYTVVVLTFSKATILAKVLW